MLKKKKYGIISTIKRKRISTVAGSWVFYLCLALVPLAFLLASAFSIFDIDASKVFIDYLPEQFRFLGESVFLEATNRSRGVTIFFIGTVLFSGSALLNQMSKDGDFIYGAKSKKRGIFRRIKAIIALIFLFVIFFAFALLFAFSGALISKVKGKQTLTYLITKTSALLLLITVCYVVIILLNKFISPIKLGAKEVLIGSLVSLLIIVLGTIGFSFYLKYFKLKSVVSGSIMYLLAFLSWLYILMLGLTIGSAVIVTINRNDKITLKLGQEKDV